VSQIDDIRADLSAFADDDEDVVIERNGDALFVRGGEEVTFRLVAPTEGNEYVVELDGVRVPYRRFVSHTLGRLDVLAERILTKRPGIPAYVDGRAKLESLSLGSSESTGLSLLQSECETPPPFASRVVFVTADAGQGKTALLREYQSRQARRFLEGRSSFVFWHVDLQGRQLLRLSEALMGDLGDLRVSGLWMPAIVRLLRHRVLVLAIDGFDELAAEQGSTDALGALALLVQQMQDQGIIVAASRRTFFDTDDYLRRAGLFGRTAAADSEFDQLSLFLWQADEAEQYLSNVSIDGKSFNDGQLVYNEIAAELDDPAHPMITRPFLVAQTARALLLYSIPPAEFIRGMEDPLRGVGAVIERFVDREVTEKWKQKETGEPYLTRDQHLRLLADIAEEMFRSQRSRLELDVIETIAALLLDEWSVDQMRRQQVLDMIKMHVLLTPPTDGDHRYRSFDHPEFRDWFTAYALKEQLSRLLADSRSADIASLLSVAQMTDATARYACLLLDRQPKKVRKLIAALSELVRKAWRPTFLEPNIGTLLPFLLDGVDPGEDPFELDLTVVYSSLVFENTSLSRVRFVHGSFVNASFRGVKWHDVLFEDCELGEVTFDRTAQYENMTIRSSRIDGIRIVGGDDEETREYAPARIRAILATIGVDVDDGSAVSAKVDVATPLEGDMRKLVNRVLRAYRRTTVLSEGVVERRFRRSAGRIRDEILPMMEAYGVVESRQWRGGGNQRAWVLSRSLEDIQRAEADARDPLHAFWADIDAHDRVVA
jgi:hypothetical protein